MDMLLEKKKRLDIVLDNLEKLIDMRLASANSEDMARMNDMLIEENNLAKDTIVAQIQELEALREKNRLALEAVQGIIKNIENQVR